MRNKIITLPLVAQLPGPHETFSDSFPCTCSCVLFFVLESISRLEHIPVHSNSDRSNILGVQRIAQQRSFAGAGCRIIRRESNGFCTWRRLDCIYYGTLTFIICCFRWVSSNEKCIVAIIPINRCHVYCAHNFCSSCESTVLEWHTLGQIWILRRNVCIAIVGGVSLLFALSLRQPTFS